MIVVLWDNVCNVGPDTATADPHQDEKVSVPRQTGERQNGQEHRYIKRQAHELNLVRSSGRLNRRGLIGWEVPRFREMRVCPPPGVSNQGGPAGRRGPVSKKRQCLTHFPLKPTSPVLEKRTRELGPHTYIIARSRSTLNNDQGVGRAPREGAYPHDTRPTRD